MSLKHPPLERMVAIGKMILEGKSFTTRELALKFELSDKSIQRDIEFMRDRLGYRIEYSYPKRRFVGVAPAQRIL